MHCTRKEDGVQIIELKDSRKPRLPSYRYFRFIVSTTCVDFLVWACFTVVKRPDLALRPIFTVPLAISFSFYGKLSVKAGGYPPTYDFIAIAYSGTRIGQARNPNAFA